MLMPDSRCVASHTICLGILNSWTNGSGKKQNVAIENIAAGCVAAVHKDLRAFKVYPMVTMWAAQYSTSRSRYGFLVLDGPSCMGKAQFARSLAPTSKGVLEINMVGSAKVDLKLYDPLLHEVLLFDECDPRAVLENKKLFQAGSACISMQTSATNIMAFNVCVAQKKFVVCSNNWWSTTMKLAWEDAEWLRANSFYVHVQEPMWEEASVDSSPLVQCSA